MYGVFRQVGACYFDDRSGASSVLGFPFDIDDATLAGHQVQVVIAIDDRQNLLAVTSLEVETQPWCRHITLIAQGNAQLAQGRAQNVYDILINQYGVAPSQLVKDSKGGVDYMYFNDEQLSRSVIISEVK